MALLLCIAVLVSCAGCGAGNVKKSETQTTQTENTSHNEIDGYLDQMTLEEKAAQLFIVKPEALVNVGTVIQAGDATKEAIDEIPVGGLIYFADNLQSKEQTKQMLETVQEYSLEHTGLPAFLSVDEEGGTVARIANSENFNVPQVGDMADIGASGDIEAARDAGQTIGAYLSELGFNLDFAPVADVLSNPDNTVVKQRSFGDDPELVADMAIAVSEGLKEHGIYSTYKHFPGHGATEADTHKGYAYTDKSLEELKACELIPFQTCIEADASFIMAAHIAVPKVTGDDTPTSVSKTMITDVLRTQLGYNGIVITDGMDMGAITEEYTSAEAAIKALQAGVDMILMPENFDEAYQGVLDAVKDGSLTEERINESLRRILAVKLQMKQDMESKKS